MPQYAVVTAPLLRILIATLLWAWVASAPANDLSDRANHPDLAPTLLSAMTACVATAEGAIPSGSDSVRCLENRLMNEHLLRYASSYFAQSGRQWFGEHFRFINKLTYAADENSLSGDMDVVIPMLFTARNKPEREANAFFWQHGITRWTDDHGARRNDVRSGLVHRFAVSKHAGGELFGLSAFMQHNLERGHSRLVTGADYIGVWGGAAMHYYLPTTDWRLGHSGYEERALEGARLSLNLKATTTIKLDLALSRWEEDDGLGGWATKGQAGLHWRPHPWLDFNATMNGFDNVKDSFSLKVALSVPLEAALAGHIPAWRGLGVAGGGAAAQPDMAWRPIDNAITKLQYAERARSLEALVRTGSIRLDFLQDTAASGQTARLQITLPTPAAEDTRLAIRLMPGDGEHPAVPGEDYIDEWMPVTIAKGSISGIVQFTLMHNPQMQHSRSLKAVVGLIAG